MNIIGKLLIAFGAIIIGKAITMDLAPKGSDIINIGLLSDRQNFTILGSVLLLAGIILFATSRMNRKSVDLDAIDVLAKKAESEGIDAAIGLFPETQCV